jgi:hypothetical protein
MALRFEAPSEVLGIRSASLTLELHLLKVERQHRDPLTACNLRAGTHYLVIPEPPDEVLEALIGLVFR